MKRFMRIIVFVYLIYLMPLVVLATNTNLTSSAPPVGHQEWYKKDFNDAVVEALTYISNVSNEEEAYNLLDQLPLDVRGEVLDILDEEASSNYKGDTEELLFSPAVQRVMRQFDVMADEIIAVQRIAPYSNGIPIDTIDVVITSQKNYFFWPASGVVQDTPPASLWTNEADVYGDHCEIVKSSWYGCSSYEWVVVFYLPVCFLEIISGRFDGIDDAWAPDPDCNFCNGGRCAGWRCGKAWDGPGYTEWWNFKDCSSSMSKKVGKQVQKRWYYSWKNCGRSDREIAQSVRAHIRW